MEFDQFVSMWWFVQEFKERKKNQSKKKKKKKKKESVKKKKIKRVLIKFCEVKWKKEYCFEEEEVKKKILLNGNSKKS